MVTLCVVVALALLAFAYCAKILDWILIVMAFPIGMAVLVATGHIPGKAFQNWWLGALISTLLFWAVIKGYRRSWRNDVFWVTVGILAALQAVLVYLVGRSVERLSPRWIYPVFIIEGPILMTTLAWTLHRFGRHQRRHRKTNS
jgi:hypothetical protein